MPDAAPETLLVLPGYGLEDLPSTLPEEQAAALLNCVAVGWHPALLAASRSLPRVVRADDPPVPLPGRTFLVPPTADEHLPDGWPGDADAAGRS